MCELIEEGRKDLKMVDTENGIRKLNKVSWRHCREERFLEEEKLADTKKNGILKLDKEWRRNFKEKYFFLE